MINKKTNPIEWALLMYELEDTKEHLSNLIEALQSAKHINENDFKIQIAHIYGHLNRIHHSRSHIGEIGEEKFIEYSRFPTDIEPI